VFLDGDQWVAFAEDPDGVENAWMQVGSGRPGLLCHTHHNGQDGHSNPPGWGEDGNTQAWMARVLCATPYYKRVV
jgi:hypothetical protein